MDDTYENSKIKKSKYNSYNTNDNDKKYYKSKKDDTRANDNSSNNNYNRKPYKKDNLVIDEKFEENALDSGKKEKRNRLKNSLNEIETICAEKTLKSNLKELFAKVREDNLGFKNNIFFRNLKDTERKVCNMDRVDEKRILHTYVEKETGEILRNLENANDLMDKYYKRVKTIVDDED